jgi:hypothetical protein
VVLHRLLDKVMLEVTRQQLEEYSQLVAVEEQLLQEEREPRTVMVALVETELHLQ